MNKLQEIYQKKLKSKKENSRFISLNQGESFQGQFVGVEETTGMFGPTNHYYFIIDGKEKIFNNKSFNFLNEMIEKEVKEGDVIEVTRYGQGYETKYKVRKINKG